MPAADYSNVLKVVPTANTFFISHRKEDSESYIITTTESGCVVFKNPAKDFAKLIYTGISQNSAFQITYSWKSQCIYLWIASGILVEYDINRDATKEYSFHNKCFPLNNCFGMTGPMGQQDSLPVEIGFPQYVETSGDGNVYFSLRRISSVPCLTKFDVDSKVFTFYGFSDMEYEHLIGEQRARSYSVGATAGAFQGTYSEYVFEDDFSPLHTTIRAEMATSGVSYNETQHNSIFLHYNDRALASATRRIFCQIDGSWKIMDIKSPANFIDSLVLKAFNVTAAWASTSWEDQASTPVDSSAWPALGILSDFEAIAIPSDFGSFFPVTRQIGRYAYCYGSCNDKAFNWLFAFHPTTGAAIYPDTFTKDTSFLNNSQDHICYQVQFNGNYGFSTSPELVLSVKGPGGVTGYYRFDTHTWSSYDFITDPDPLIQVLGEVDIDSADDPNWVGVHIDTLGSATDVDFLGQTWRRAPGGAPSWARVAFNLDFAQTVDPDFPVADLSFEMTPDFLGSTIYTSPVPGASTVSGRINSFFITEDELYAIFLGSNSAGISDYTLAGFVQNDYNSVVPSGRGGIQWGDFIIFYGYLGSFRVVDTSVFPHVLSSVSIGAFVNEQQSAAARVNEVVFTGIGVRDVNYRNGYGKLGYANSTTAFGFPNQPNFINDDIADTIRNTTFNLPNNTYTDQEVEDEVLAYLTANPSETRTDVINLFLDSALWRMLWVTTYGDKIVFSMERLVVAALSGIRLNDQPFLAGNFIDETNGMALDWPSALYIDIVDPSTAVVGDYKEVEFQVTGLQGVASIGRCFAGTGRIAWINNEGDNAVVRIVTTANFETAATGSGIITAFDDVVTIPLGTGGFAGNAENFTGIDRLTNFAFTIGDNLYFTVSTENKFGGNFITAYRMDMTTGTYTELLTATEKVETTISHNVNTDILTIGRREKAWKIDMFTLQALPIILT